MGLVKNSQGNGSLGPVRKSAQNQGMPGTRGIVPNERNSRGCGGKSHFLENVHFKKILFGDGAAHPLRFGRVVKIAPAVSQRLS
jgi:hypothetical protein